MNAEIFLPILLVLYAVSFPIFGESKDTSYYPFGRLFTSPEQRAFLDEFQQRTIISGKNEEKPKDTVPAALSELDEADASKNRKTIIDKDVALSGYVVRQDGSYVVWVNGKSILSETPPETVKTGKPHTQSGQVLVKANNRRVALKPGQVWQMGEAQVKESYEIPKEEETVLDKLVDKLVDRDKPLDDESEEEEHAEQENEEGENMSAEEAAEIATSEKEVNPLKKAKAIKATIDALSPE